MGQFSYKARTLDDKFVQQGLCAVAALEDFPETREKAMVVGGIATQSYLPSNCRRGTSDIDLAVIEPLTYSRFKRFAKPVVEYLADNGYDVRLEKAHSTNRIIFSADGEGLVIEFPRKSPRNFERKAKNLEREFAHSRIKLVEEQDATYRVVSPEDIAVPKIARCTTYLELDDSLCRFIEDAKPTSLSDEEMKEMLGMIEYNRAVAELYPDDAALSRRTRFLSDIFDIRMLSESTGFNERYFAEALQSWENISSHPASSRLLLNYLVPRMRLIGH